MATDLQKIINQKEDSDSYFLIGGPGGEELHTHAIILAMRNARLSQVLSEGTQAKVGVSDSREKICTPLPSHILSVAVQHFVEYLYTDEFRLPLHYYAAFYRYLAQKEQSKARTEGEVEEAEVDEEQAMFNLFLPRDEGKAKSESPSSLWSKQWPASEHAEEEERNGRVLYHVLELCHRFETKALEDEIRQRLASPQLASSRLARSITGTLSTNLACAFNNPLFSDLVIRLPHEGDHEKGDGDLPSTTDDQVDGTSSSSSWAHREIKAHKCILAARSQYFRAMLLSGLRESYLGEMIVPDHIRPLIFTNLLRYLYTGSIDITPETVVELFIAANEYSIVPVIKQSERMIENALDLENVTDLLDLANLHGSNELKQVCINFVLKELNRPNDSEEQLKGNLEHFSSELLTLVCSRIQSQQTGDIPLPKGAPFVLRVECRPVAYVFACRP